MNVTNIHITNIDTLMSRIFKHKFPADSILKQKQVLLVVEEIIQCSFSEYIQADNSVDHRGLYVKQFSCRGVSLVGLPIGALLAYLPLEVG